MKISKTVLVVLCSMLLLADASAQTRRGRRRAAKPPSPKPAVNTSAPTPAPARPSVAAPILLATVNGQSVTTADLEPRARQEMDTLETRIAEARKQILETEINTLLLAVEAARRKITPQRLYEFEVTRKLSEPTAAEIQRFIEENRDQLDPSDPETARRQVAAYLKSERESAQSDALVKKLRLTRPVVFRADINSPNLSPATVLVTVGGIPLTAGPIQERLKPITYKMRMGAYLAVRNSLERTITDLLLIADANRRNLTPDVVVRNEISDKLRLPTDAEIAKFYEDNKSRLNGQSQSQARNSIADYLHEQERQRLERTLAERLRKDARIQIHLSEPAQPVQLINVDDDPVLGNPSAPVTIVEFTDFQCPSCAAMHPILEEALKTYGNKVRLVVRDFPLITHANARKAAEAANAAHAQGKFAQYTSLLFKNQNALDVPSLKKYASEIGLDRARFDAALDSGKYALEVRKDIAEGELFGVESTPTIFVNGVQLRFLSQEALNAAIDRALGASQTTAPASR